MDEYINIPNLDHMALDDLENYKSFIKNNEGPIWSAIKKYVSNKCMAMHYRIDGYINKAICLEQRCDSIYNKIKEHLDW